MPKRIVSPRGIMLRARPNEFGATKSIAILDIKQTIRKNRAVGYVRRINRGRAKTACESFRVELVDNREARSTLDELGNKGYQIIGSVSALHSRKLSIVITPPNDPNPPIPPFPPYPGPKKPK